MVPGRLLRVSVRGVVVRHSRRTSYRRPYDQTNRTGAGVASLSYYSPHCRASSSRLDGANRRQRRSMARSLGSVSMSVRGYGQGRRGSSAFRVSVREARSGVRVL